MTADSAAKAQSTARDVEDSDAVHGLARLGLAARGLVWLVIGLLALSVLLGGSEQIDQGGALREVADKPFGTVLLVVLAVGFFGHALWRLLSAAVGHSDEDGAKRWLKRAGSLLRGLVYASLGVAVVRFLTAGASSDKTKSVTADVMAATGGRWLVGLGGLVAIGIGIAMAVRGVRQDHADKLESWRMPAGLRRPAVRIGVVGQIGRGAVFTLIGAFLLRAAWLFDPEQAKGLDAALATVSQQPYGKALLALAVLGVLAFAIWSFVEALYKKL